MDFGVTVLPDPPFSRWLELIQLAERHGFGYAWTYDSHVLWQESVPMLAVAARETSKIKLGHFVTNPATRDPTVLASAYATLQDLPDGRRRPRSSSGSWTRRAAPPRRPDATRPNSSASSARRPTSPRTSPTRASRCGGSRRWSRTTSWT